MKKLKERIYTGETVFGCWLNLGSLVSAEIVGNAGFDWVLIDLEHGAGDVSVMYHQLQVLKGTRATALVRTDASTRARVQRILDAGATGIMFPQVRERQEAREAVTFMYYPPKGVRGMARQTRATVFGVQADEYVSNTEKTLITIIQIETLEALKDVESIAATDGVDVLFIGPNDLSIALGVFRDFNSASYQDAIRRVAEAARNAGKIAGVLLQDVHEHRMYADLGYSFIACGADGGFVARGANDTIRQLRKGIT